MKNTTEAEHSDVLILGGGSGGYATALRASQLGLKVTLIEADKIGGTCLHRGCIPTKALLHVAEVAETCSAARTVGVNVDYIGFDLPTVHNFQNSIVERLYTGLLSLIRHRQINVVPGRGRFVGDRTIEAAGATYTGESVVLATGSHPSLLPDIQIGHRIVTSDEALTLKSVPEEVVVLGGGVIGVEFASIWNSFGSKVTIVEALPRLLATEDPWSSKQLERAFARRGITVLTDTKLTSAAETDLNVTVTTSAGEFESDAMLVAVGRRPCTDDLELERYGVEIDRGFVTTNERLHTTANSVYAVGDLVAGPQLAHRGFQHGMFVAEEIAGLAPVCPQDHQYPRVTYSHPEVASVGLSENTAREQFGEISTTTYDLSGNAKSQILHTSGGIKVIRVGASSSPGPIVGVHMVGSRVSEMIGEAQLTVGWEALPEEVGHFIHAHPTQNEALGEAMLALAGRSLHSHG